MAIQNNVQSIVDDQSRSISKVDDLIEMNN